MKPNIFLNTVHIFNGILPNKVECLCWVFPRYFNFTLNTLAISPKILQQFWLVNNTCSNLTAFHISVIIFCFCLLQVGKGECFFSRKYSIRLGTRCQKFSLILKGWVNNLFVCFVLFSYFFSLVLSVGFSSYKSFPFLSFLLISIYLQKSCWTIRLVKNLNK